MLFTINWEIPCPVFNSTFNLYLLHALQISYYALWSSTSNMITFCTAIVFAFNSIAAHAFTYLARVLIYLIIPNPEMCWLALWFFFSNSLFFIRNKKYCRKSPHRAFRMQLNNDKIYPYFSVFVHVLLHDAPKAGTELAGNVRWSIL